MKVQDVMSTDVIAVTADTPIKEVARILRDRDIGGLPVVDDDNSVVGMIGEADLVPKEMPLPFTRVTVPSLFKKIVSRGKLDLEALYDDMKDFRADQVMEKNVISVEADDDVGQAAWLMAHHKVKRLPVLRDGKLAGILTRSDLIKILAAEADEDSSAPTDS